MRLVFVILSCLLCTSTAITVQYPIKAIHRGFEGVLWSNITGSVVLDSVDAGYNMLLLNFFADKEKQAYDSLEAWKTVDQTSKQVAITYAHNKGAVVLGLIKLAAFYGAPYSMNATELASRLTAMVIDNVLDGCVVNFQDVNQGFTVAEGTNLTAWAIEFLTACRIALGPDRLLSIAASPVSFGPVGNNNTYAGASGGLLGVYKAIPDMIDQIYIWYFLQNPACLASYDVLFVSSASVADKCNIITAFGELLQAGLPANKSIVTIAAEATAETPGYVAPESLAGYLVTANASMNWTTGVSLWSWLGVAKAKNWITVVYTPPITTTPTPVTTSTPTSSPTSAPNPTSPTTTPTHTPTPSSSATTPHASGKPSSTTSDAVIHTPLASGLLLVTVALMCAMF